MNPTDDKYPQPYIDLAQEQLSQGLLKDNDDPTHSALSEWAQLEMKKDAKNAYGDPSISSIEM